MPFTRVFSGYIYLCLRFSCKFNVESLIVSFFLSSNFKILWSLVVQMLKCLPAMPETWVWSLGQEEPLENGNTTHSSVARGAWWTTVHGSQRVGHDWATNTHNHIHTPATQNISLMQYLKEKRGKQRNADLWVDKSSAVGKIFPQMSF